MFKRILVRLDNFFYRVVLRNILKLSKLGYGFIVSGAESGENFEHIYNNRPQGVFLIGKFIDKVLLNLPSVQATRERKEEIKKILRKEISINCSAGRQTRVLDLASGGARYLRELKVEHETGDVESLCVDRNMRCVNLGRTLAKREGVKNIKFLRADIFRLGSLKVISERIHWKPNVIIASGLFIYFNDETVARILREIYQSLPKGGLVIFQSYENLNSRKLMRKTSATSTGEQWTLYYRKPLFWEQLLKKIGFEEIMITRDEWKMNNICSARKMVG
ncbi:MAG TPA: class I SAM-dependent methyltransferase family protein [Candidatus Omnitrophota bacterium]|nr:class I SAM-dependent methyltransferase family protein [Candidatus Omnitrophota bacterium]HQB11487.1 class I SAM-dependent methyltransferase family protein [Candidatus Omnitrophota bacterium]